MIRYGPSQSKAHHSQTDPSCSATCSAPCSLSFATHHPRPIHQLVNIKIVKTIDNAHIANSIRYGRRPLYIITLFPEYLINKRLPDNPHTLILVILTLPNYWLGLRRLNWRPIPTLECFVCRTQELGRVYEHNQLYLTLYYTKPIYMIFGMDDQKVSKLYILV